MKYKLISVVVIIVYFYVHSDVFPLQKIYHLWDTLLLGNSSFPLFIGVAILQQLRAQLLTYGFNECILLFSDMPEIDIERCVQDSIKIFQSTPKSIAARQHDNISTNDKSKAKTGKEFLSVEQLKSEKCPRLSLQDMLHILDIRCDETGGSPRMPPSKSKSMGIVVDIRPPEEYNRVHLSGSINMPWNQTFSEDNKLVPCESATILQASKGKIIIVLGARSNNCPKFAEELVEKHFLRVCVLDASGLSAMRTIGLMSLASV